MYICGLVQLNPIVLVAAIIVFVWYVWNRVSLAKGAPPGPIAWPVIGNIPSLLGTNLLHARLMELRNQYGDIVSLRMGPHINMVVLFGHDNIHEFLVEKAHQTSYRPNWIYMIDKLFKQKGIIWSDGAHWQHIRRVTLSTLKDFGVGQESLEKRVIDEVDIVCNLISEIQGTHVQLADYLPKAISNIISSIVFGSRFHFNDPEFTALMEILDYVFKNAGLNLPSNFMPILAIVSPYSKVRTIEKMFADVEAYITKQIQQHRKSFDPDNIRDFIDLYLEHSIDEDLDVDLTERDVFQIIFDLYAAGSETTSTSLLWIMLYLVKYPDVQQMCRDELDNVVGKERLVSLHDKYKMPYTCAVMNEVQRLSTIAAVGIPHAVLEDITIGGKTIRKNTMVITHLWSVHYDQKYWEDPYEFRPQRFLSEDNKLIKHEAFYPFSAGPRKCIGKPLAEMEMFLFITRFLQRFEFSSPDPFSLDTEGVQPGITVLPKPYKVLFKERANYRKRFSSLIYSP